MDFGGVLKWGLIGLAVLFGIRMLGGLRARASVSGLGQTWQGNVWPGYPLGAGVLEFTPGMVSTYWNTGPAWPYGERVHYGSGNRQRRGR